MGSSIYEVMLLTYTSVVAKNREILVTRLVAVVDYALGLEFELGFNPKPLDDHEFRLKLAVK